MHIYSVYIFINFGLKAQKWTWVVHTNNPTYTFTPRNLHTYRIQLQFLPSVGKLFMKTKTKIHRIKLK